MSLPYTIYEAKLVQAEDRRGRSLASHDQLMHLPQGKSLLERLLDRIRSMPAARVETRQQPVSNKSDAGRPPAFSS